MYKYQKETINKILETFELLEGKTEARKSLKIGFIRDEFWTGNEWVEHSGHLRVKLNSKHRFVLFDSNTDFYKALDEVDDDAYVRIDSNVFLKLNDFIDEVYKEKREREGFHERLNKELEALNKAL